MKKTLFSLLVALCLTLILLPATAMGADHTHNYVGGVCTGCALPKGLMYKIRDNEVTVAYYAGSVTNLTIPATIEGKRVTAIGDTAFLSCSSLVSVTIPEGVTDIGIAAFRECSNLTSVTLPESVVNIDAHAFCDCSSLVSITIPGSVAVISDGTFNGCSSLTDVTIHEGITSIGKSAFSGCSSLTAITVPKGVTAIGSNAFYNCRSLASATIPEGVTSIGESAFNGCSSLTAITVPKGVTAIGDNTFGGCSSLVSAAIPDGVTSIGVGAFDGCSSLAAITLPESVTSIGVGAFNNCSSLAAITVPSGVASIGGSAFNGCSSLASVTISEGVSSINGSAFRECSSLSAITIPDSVTSIRDEAFFGCSSLEKMIFEGAAPEMEIACFGGVTATAYYPCNNETWTADKCKDYGGDITWKANHDYQNSVCTVCGDKDIPIEGVDRICGGSRYDTAFQSADTLKKVMGVEKFSAAVVTSGENFADALAGSYLAYVKNAPILLTDNDNIKDVMDYIKENVEKGGTIYALGGKAVVTDKLLELEGKSYAVKRLSGDNRFETNLEILKECGSVAGKDILVCTGFNFADSLSASAAKRPILLVDDKLTDEQKNYLKQQSGCKYYIAGGTGAVTGSVEKSLKSYGAVERLAGSNRFETSVMVAKKFFSDPTTAVLAYGYNFPDGLCAGPLAATINAPLILTATGDEAQAAAYAKEEGIKDGMVLGGPTLIGDKAVKKIFSMGSGDKIK